MLNFYNSHNDKTYRLLVTLLKKHSKDIWQNWSANICLDPSLPLDFKYMLKLLFGHFFETFNSACDHLLRNNLTEFYNQMTEKWLLPNQFTINPDIIRRGMVSIENTLFPFLINMDSETRGSIIYCFQDITLQLIHIMHDISKGRILTSQFETVEGTSTVVCCLEMLPVKQVSLAKINGDYLIILEEWQRKGKYLKKIQKAANKMPHNFALEELEENDAQLITLQDGFVLIISGIRGFTQDNLNQLYKLASLLNGDILMNKQIVTLREQISRLELLNDLDEMLIRYSGTEGLMNAIDVCQKILNFKRVALFGYSPFLKTIEGILGRNFDQQKIQSFREPVNKLTPFKDAYLTKKPVHLFDSSGKIPDVYVERFGLTSVLIVPIINDNKVYGWLILDQQGEKFETSKRVLEFSEIIGLRIGTYMGRSELTIPFNNEMNINITEREAEILKFLAEGCDNKTIGEILNISEHTVRDHVSNLLIKFNAKNRAQVVAAGFRYRILQ